MIAATIIAIDLLAVVAIYAAFWYRVNEFRKIFLAEIRRLSLHRYRLALHLRQAILDRQQTRDYLANSSRLYSRHLASLQERNEALHADLAAARGEYLALKISALILTESLRADLDSVRAQACLDSQIRSQEPSCG